MNHPELHQLRRLKLAVDGAIAYLEAGLPTYDMTPDELRRFRSEYSDADFRIDDFEIRDRAMRWGKAGASPGLQCGCCQRRSLREAPITIDEHIHKGLICDHCGSTYHLT